MAEHADPTKLGSSISSYLPLLVFQHRYADQDDDGDDVDDEMLMFSISKQSLHKNMEHGLLAVGSSSMFWTTPQGWILLCRTRDPDAEVSSACLWNPSTGDKLPLPDIIAEEHEIPHHNKCILSHKDPTLLGCVVVLFNYETPDFWYCHTAGDDGSENSSISWRRHSYDIGNWASAPKPPKGKKARRSIRPIKRVISVMASFQGKIYFNNLTSKENSMCAIDFSSCTSAANSHNRPRFQKFKFPFVDLPENFSSGSKWLVESQDQLFAITMGFIAFNPNNIGAIEVYRLDYSSSTQQACWHRVHDIGDNVFVLDQHAEVAASCSASALGLKPNQIFFMKNIIDDDADLCIFDLETNTQAITQVHQHDDLILCRKPFWIVPPS